VEWREFWSRYAREAYDDVALLAENRRLLARVCELVGSRKRILDAGCGTGNLTVELARNNRVTAIDFSPDMVAACRRKAGGSRDVAVHIGDVTGLRLPGDSFDAVASVNVLFNLSKPKQALDEAHRVLKPGGILVACSLLKGQGLTQAQLEQARSEWKEQGLAPERLERVLGFHNCLFESGGVKFTPTLDEMSGMLRQAGFDVLSTEKVYFDANFLVAARKAGT